MVDIGQQRQIAYTVGAECTYDDALSGGEHRPCKLGRSADGYEGGWVWSEASAARAFLSSSEFSAAFVGTPPRCAVYELELPAPWAAAVNFKPEPSDGVHRLLMDARIVRKVIHAI